MGNLGNHLLLGFHFKALHVIQTQ